MTTAGAVLTGIVGLVLCAIVLEARLGRRKSRPLASRFLDPVDRPALGMEATDLTKAAEILRRNDALAAKTGAGGQSQSWTSVGAVPSSPIGKDAARENG